MWPTRRAHRWQFFEYKRVVMTFDFLRSSKGEDTLISLLLSS